MTTFQVVVPDVFLDWENLALVRDCPHGIFVRVWALEEPSLKKEIYVLFKSIRLKFKLNIDKKYMKARVFKLAS
jgi:hypothetical protein